MLKHKKVTDILWGVADDSFLATLFQPVPLVTSMVNQTIGQKVTDQPQKVVKLDFLLLSLDYMK